MGEVGGAPDWCKMISAFVGTFFKRVLARKSMKTQWKTSIFTILCLFGVLCWGYFMVLEANMPSKQLLNIEWKNYHIFEVTVDQQTEQK